MDPASTEEAPKTQTLDRPTFPGSPGPTPPWKSIDDPAQDVGEAAGFARDMLTQNPPFWAVDVTSLAYAEASVGEAREFFGYSREDNATWDIADDVSAVLFVAEGTFECYASRFSETPTPRYTTMWIIVALGEPGTRAGCDNERHDLSKFGDVRGVPLPLPPFPTPVSLGHAVGA
jgi:hypothetical protein